MMTKSNILWKIFIICSLIVIPYSALAIEPDEYENDDIFTKGKVIFLNKSQSHNFHQNSDADWVIFRTISGKKYEIKTDNLQSRCDVMIELYDTDGISLLEKIDDAGYGESEIFSETFDKEGFYYLKITNANSGDYGENTGYELYLSLPYGDGNGSIIGYVRDKESKQGLANVPIEIKGKKGNNYPTKYSEGKSKNENTIGMYDFGYIEEDTYQLTATLKGYETFSDTVNVKEFDFTEKIILMVPDSPPTCNITYSSDNKPANQDVTAALKCDEAVTITNNGGSATYTFTANGEFTFSFQDAAGNAGSAIATVNWIDKISPTCSNITYSTNSLTNQDVTANLTKCSEDVTVTNNGGALTYLFTANGEFTFEFKDAAGNTGSAAAKVDWIDKTLPTCDITYSPDNKPTNQDVTATLKFSEPVIMINPDKSDKYIEEYLYTFTANGEFTFEFKDEAGNTGTATATVTWIDKTTPTCNITYCPDKPIKTNQNVIATLTCNEPVTITSNDGSVSHTFPENSEFTFEFKDAAGNTGSAAAKVNWIDKSLSIQDAILILQILTGVEKTGKDINCDGKIGLEDVIYILQVFSGSR